MRPLFEWQRHSQKSSGVPDYRDLLEFLNLRAQASESSVQDTTQRKPKVDTRKSFVRNGAIASFASNAEDHSSSSKSACILCGPEKYPLYACPKFKGMQHETKVSTLKSHGMCMNCLGPKHFSRNCKLIHRCRTCQRPHHSLLHVDGPHASIPPETEAVNSTPVTVASEGEVVSSHTNTPLKSNSLLMTCRVFLSKLPTVLTLKLERYSTMPPLLLSSLSVSP